MPQVSFKHDWCKKCGICIQVCPKKNLELKNNKVRDLGNCTGCKLCEIYCPDFALEIKP